jgi:hypothetical protein
MQSKIMHCKMLPRLERWFCQLSVDGKVSEPRARTIEKNQHSRKQEIGWNIETCRLGPWVAPSAPRHSRAGGNPAPRHSRAGGKPVITRTALDSRLRGND